MKRYFAITIVIIFILSLLPGYASAGTAEPSIITARATAPDLKPGQISQMYEEYTVKRGDSLSSIGRQFGVSWRDIAKLNDIHGPKYTIRPGQILKIPQSLTSSPSYVKQLRKNAVKVNTEKEFANALKTAYVIELKKDITLSENLVTLDDINALVIDEGVTLTVTSMNFHATCAIVNLGEIIVKDSGRMIFHSEPDYSCIGKISTRGRFAQIAFNSGKIGADEMTYFLSEDSLYDSLNIVASSSDGKPVEILVDHDIVIPASKTLWINSGSVLHVSKGVKLTNNGTISYFNEPIIDGKIVGIGEVIDN